jgi:hypothetical protein
MVYDTEKFKDVDPENLESIFSDKKLYRVPHSQRNFSWNTVDDDKTKNQVGKFWNALLRQWKKFQEQDETAQKLNKEIATGTASDGTSLSPEQIRDKRETLATLDPQKIAEYFIGPMVFSKTDRGTGQLDVIDGQQRLSVLTIIFAICRDIYFEIHEQKYIDNEKIDFEPIQLSLIDLLEVSGMSRTPNPLSVGQWRFQPNAEDADLFNKIILPWDVKQHAETNSNLPKNFREKNSDALCLRLEEKVKYFYNQINDKTTKNNYEKGGSNLKIIRTYLTIYDSIWTGILTDFILDTDKQDDIKNKIEVIADDEIDFILHEDPTKFDLPPDFFTNEKPADSFAKMGMDIIQKRQYNLATKEYEDQDWSDKIKEKLEKQFKSDNHIGETEPIDPIEFKKWLVQVIEKKEKKGLQYLSIPSLTKNDTFEKIKTELKRDHVHKLTRERSLENISNDKLSEFITNMCKQLLFSVRITLQDTKTANLVFKTLNSAGEPLTTANLIKNHILDYVDDEDERKEIAENWDEIIKKVRKYSSPDDFLELSLKSRGVKYGELWEFDQFKVADLKTPVKVTDDTLYDILEQKIQTEQQAKDYVTELQEDVEIYLKLKDPSEFLPNESRPMYDNNKEIGPALYILKTLDYVYANIPIMAAWRHWGQLTETTWNNFDLSFVVLIKILTIWLFRFKTIRNNSGAASNVESAMTKITKYIINNSNENPEDIAKVMTNVQKFLLTYDNDGDFYYNLKSTSLKKSSKNIDVTILTQITKHLAPASREFPGYQSLEREHVLPQESGKWALGDFQSDWSPIAKDGGEDIEQRMFDLVTYFDNKSIPTDPHGFEDMVHVLGNLNLVTDKVNKKISNLPFNEKKYHFNKAHKKAYLKTHKCCEATTCDYFSDTGISTKDYLDPVRNFVIPSGTVTYCPKHAEQDGYSGSEFSLTTNTIMKNESDDFSDRTEWTALSIMERTKFLVEKTYALWRLPKIYCTKSTCSKYLSPINSIKGDLIERQSIENDEIDTFIGNKKCTEKLTSGEICCGKLEVLWYPVDHAPDLDVPSDGNKPSDARNISP